MRKFMKRLWLYFHSRKLRQAMATDGRHAILATIALSIGEVIYGGNSNQAWIIIICVCLWFFFVWLGEDEL